MSSDIGDIMRNQLQVQTIKSTMSDCNYTAAIYLYVTRKDSIKFNSAQINLGV